MKYRLCMAFAVLLAASIPACVSTQQTDRDDYEVEAETGSVLYGSIESDAESYPWLSPRHDKGIYSSSAETSPFRENTLTYQNLSPRLQKTSKKSKK
ncbi:MAG: hypothetical protein RIR26_432 [Pseudomonadota bacterium]|jgi:hypothetical protein